MTAPDPLAAALAWLATFRGIDRGIADAHAGVLLGHIDRLTTERDRQWERARRAEHAAREARQKLLDVADPNRPGAWIQVMHAINALPAVQEARPPLEQLGRAPTPHRRTP